MTFPWKAGTTDRENNQESEASSKEHRLMLSASILTLPCYVETEWKKLPSIASLAINSAHMQKHHAQLTFNLKFLAQCSPRTAFGLFPSGYPSVSLPGEWGNYFRRFLTLAGDLWIRFISQKSNHGIGQNLFWTKTTRQMKKNLPGPLPGKPTSPSGKLPGLRDFAMSENCGETLRQKIK